MKNSPKDNPSIIRTIGKTTVTIDTMNTHDNIVYVITPNKITASFLAADSSITERQIIADGCLINYYRKH